MPSQRDIELAAGQLLSTKGFSLASCTTLQSLWAGYGQVCQIKAISTRSFDLPKQGPISMILKYISPPAINDNLIQREGHIRKILSYQVEQYFYTHLAVQMPQSIAVPLCLSTIDSISGSNGIAMLMTDLSQTFTLAGEKAGQLNEIQVYAAIDWLASFHGFWWTKVKTFDRSKLCRPPLQHFEQTKGTTRDEGVWLNGGYTYLATRQEEYLDLSTSDSDWRLPLCTPLTHSKSQLTIAEIVAEFLAPLPDDSKIGPISQYETLIHGDVKSENLFTTARGDSAAFFDFQYVGLGLGVCDLAKLFTCSVPEHMLTSNPPSINENEMTMGHREKELLQYYLQKVQQVSGKRYEWEVFVRHWEIGLVDWLRFQASWGFWGNTEWLEARVRSILNDEEWMAYIIYC